mmetsp:Transcript_21410/g.33494  ORF Transcript_21410/g.33494 Transcript_21410/m.33494 type:complete len:219 (+) Transcript_21410:73-729(+)
MLGVRRLGLVLVLVALLEVGERVGAEDLSFVGSAGAEGQGAEELGAQAKEEQPCDLFGDYACNVRPDNVISTSGMELKQVILIHRHGDRTPLSKGEGSFLQDDNLTEFWKTKLPSTKEIEAWGDLNLDLSGTWSKGEGDDPKWPQGHLTQLGAKQMQELGGYLRERYIDELQFLPEDLPAGHDGEIVTVRSTRSQALACPLQSQRPQTLNHSPKFLDD